MCLQKKVLLLCLFIVTILTGCGAASDNDDRSENNTFVEDEDKEMSDNSVDGVADILGLSEKRKFSYEAHGMIRVHDGENAYWIYGDNVLEVPKHERNKIASSYYAVNADASELVMFTNFGDLYQFKNGSVKFVDERAHFYGGYFLCWQNLARNGSKVIYEYGNHDEKKQAILYDLETEERIVISDTGTPIVLSPDGNSVVYYVNTGEYRDSDSIYYIYTNGEVYEIGSDIDEVLAVADCAEYVYYVKNNELYMLVGKKEHKKIMDNVASGLGLIFNETYTKLLCAGTDGLYFVEDGKKPVKLNGTGQIVSMLVPEYTFKRVCGEMDVWNPELGIYTFMDLGCYYGTNSLLNQFYCGKDGMLFYINDAYDVIQIDDHITEAKMSKNGRAVYYIKNNELYYLKGSNLTQPTLLEENVSTVMIQSENKVYYKDTANCLWYKEGKDKPQLIAENVTMEQLTYDDSVVFFTDYHENRGMLYGSKNGSAKQLISEDAVLLRTEGKTTYFAAGYSVADSEIKENVDLYMITENLGSKLLLEDVLYDSEDGSFRSGIEFE